MKKSLFIGRFQPFHDGHEKLIRTVIKEGKRPVIAIRDTKPDKNNPYSSTTRMAMVRERFGEDVDIILIPDIQEVCYGRDVGYKIREIRLDTETENIRATFIRQKK